MDEARALCVIASDEAAGGRVERALGDEVTGRFESVDEATESLDGGRALLVAGPDVPAATILDLARTINEDDRDWILLRTETDPSGDPSAFRPVSVGFRLDAERVRKAAREGDEAEPVFDLLEVLRRVSTIRHDINNPLTAGLAETQLLLMDVEEGEVRDSLETIQRQLRRIQELVETLNDLRRPTRSVG